MRTKVSEIREYLESQFPSVVPLLLFVFAIVCELLFVSCFDHFFCLSLSAHPVTKLFCEFRTENDKDPRIEWKKTKGTRLSSPDFVYFDGAFRSNHVCINSFQQTLQPMSISVCVLGYAPLCLYHTMFPLSPIP